MNLGSSQQATPAAAVPPVGSYSSIPAKAAPGFYKAYEATHGEDDTADHGQKKNCVPASQEAKPAVDSENSSLPDIFKILKKYRFKDFFDLKEAEQKSTLQNIVKKSRKTRGVSGAQPLSNKHRQTNVFIKRMTGLYQNATWLMRVNPGKGYNQLL